MEDAPSPRQTWGNLHLCRVEAADTLWVREVPSRAISEELKQFLEFERQMNKYYNNRLSQHCEPSSLVKVRDHVVVCYKSIWARGQVKKVAETRAAETKVFLLDYGVTVSVGDAAMVTLEPGQWRSVPYQAKKIHLFGVKPTSLQYSFKDKEVKVILRKSIEWDPSATEFMKSVSRMKPTAKFTPMFLGPDGCQHGTLHVSLPRKSWIGLVPELSPGSSLSPAEEVMTLDLAKVLVDCQFAEFWEGSDDEDLDRNADLPLNGRHLFRARGNVLAVRRSDHYKPEVHSGEEVVFPGTAPSLKAPCEEPVAGELNTTPSSKGPDSLFPLEGLDVCIRQLPDTGETYRRHSTPIHSETLPDDICSVGSTNDELDKVSSRPCAGQPSESDGNSNSLALDQPFEKSLNPSLATHIAENLPAPHQDSRIATQELPHTANFESAMEIDVNSKESSSFASNEDSVGVKRRNSNHDLSSTLLNITPERCAFATDRVLAPVGLLLKPHSMSPIVDRRIMMPNFKGKEKSTVSSTCIVDNKEPVHHAQCNDTLSDLSIDDELSDISEVVADKKFIDVNQSLKSGGKGTISADDRDKDLQNSSRSKLPQWVCTNLVGAVQGVVHKTQKEQGTLKDSMPLPEGNASQVCGNMGNNEAGGDALCHEENLGTREKPTRIHEKDNAEYTQIQATSISRKKASEPVNMSFMSDSRNVWTDQSVAGLDEGVYGSIVQQHPHSVEMNIARTYRVFVAGESPIVEEEVMVNEDIIRASLNSHVVKALGRAGMKATRLQAYMWPAVARGNSTIVVGEKSCGKSMGYVVPLISTILDIWQHIHSRLLPGIGPVMLVVCSTWRNAKCVADYIVSLLPADAPLKVMTAWGGCGREEEISTGKQLLGGCDILLTTAPCLMRLLTGDSTPWEGEPNGATTTLARCCHLVVDDADVTLQKYPSEIKQIFTTWGEGRKKCGRRDLDQQAVLVGSKWTQLYSQLTHTLLPLLDPTIIMSTPYEAAIATKVASHVHFASNETEALSIVVELIKVSYIQRKNIVFVSSDSVAEMFSLMMKHAAIYCVVADSAIQRGRLQQLVHEWHMMQGITMVVSKGAELFLLYHDLADAQTIFHTHFGPPLSVFTHRYGFMMDNFAPDLKQKSVNCESHLIVSKCTLERVPSLLNELNRICTHVPNEVKVAGSIVQDGMHSKYSALCYYLKAYGRCLVAASCKFRHKVKPTDIPQSIPQTGEVTFEVLRVLNASRYLVRLIEYREKSGAQSIELTNNYLALFASLQQHFADSSQHEPLKHVEPGMLCSVEDNGRWARAQVVTVNYSKTVCTIKVFLIDEGKEVNVELGSAMALPPHLAAVPEMIVEVFLCRIQPMDQDVEWTFQASNFVHEAFAKGENIKYVGRIVLALGHTLWLNPVVRFTKVGKTFIPSESFRGKLLSKRFGMDNPTHMEDLKQLCTQAGISLESGDVCSEDWRETISQALRKLNIANSEEDHSSDKVTNCESEVDSSDKGQESEEQINELVIEPNTTVSPTITQESAVITQDQGRQEAPPIPLRCTATTLTLPREELPLNTELRVEVGELLSPERFFVIREDRLEQLDDLESEIKLLSGFFNLCEKQRSSGRHPHSLGPKPSPASPCIAKFTNERYYRGWVEGDEPDGSMRVFFIDHGETLEVPSQQVHACPDDLMEALPGQALPCTLAHLSVPAHRMREASFAMLHLTDSVDIWTVKVLEVRETEDGSIYAVELTDNSTDPPKEMWKELVSMGVATPEKEIAADTDDESFPSELLNVSNIEDDEIAEFLLGISPVKQDDTLETGITGEAGQGMQQKSEITDMQQENTLTDNTIGSEEETIVDGARENIVSTLLEGAEGKTLPHDSDDSFNRKNQNTQTVTEPEGNLAESEVSTSLSDRPASQGSGESVGKKKRIKVKNRTQDNCNRALALSTNAYNNKCLVVPPLQAVQGITDRLSPETTWSQQEETVRVTLHLVGVEVYKCRMLPSHLVFMTVLGQKYYVLDEELANEIDVDPSFVNVQGTCVSITLKKAVRGKWERLLKDKGRRPWLRAEYQNLSSGEESSSESEAYDEEGWSAVTGCNQAQREGGLPAGISDTDSISDDLEAGEDFLLS